MFLVSTSRSLFFSFPPGWPSGGEEEEEGRSIGSKDPIFFLILSFVADRSGERNRKMGGSLVRVEKKRWGKGERGKERFFFFLF